MSDRTPEEIRIRRRALTVLRQVMIAALPDEGCALLLGELKADPVAVPAAAPPPGWASPATPDPAGGSDPAGCMGQAACVWQIGLIWPCRNVWLPSHERSRLFALDPREQLLAQRWGRRQGLAVLGAAHSHPRTAPQPSATDLSLAVLPCLQLILSPLQDWQPACWWLEPGVEGEPTARPLRWRMVP